MQTNQDKAFIHYQVELLMTEIDAYFDERDRLEDKT